MEKIDHNTVIKFLTKQEKSTKSILEKISCDWGNLLFEKRAVLRVTTREVKKIILKDARKEN